MRPLRHNGRWWQTGSTKELWDWGAQEEEHSSSLHTHANTCLKHIGQTRAVVFEMGRKLICFFP